jgi:hypothetical protein
LENKINSLQVKLVIPIIAVLAFAGIVFGNGLPGQRLEKVVGDLIVDIGTDQTLTPVAGEPIEFDFNLLASDTRDPVNSTSVGVDIGHDGKSMVNCDLITEAPLTFLFYTFPEAGNYTLKVTFFDKTRALATASFPITISGRWVRMRGAYIAVMVLIIIGGVLVSYWGARRRRGAAA